MSDTKYPIRHLPLILLDNGWFIKASDWEGSHITLFVVSKHTGQTFIKYALNQTDVETFLYQLASHSAKLPFSKNLL